MKISSRIDGSIYGAILSSRPSRRSAPTPFVGGGNGTSYSARYGTWSARSRREAGSTKFQHHTARRPAQTEVSSAFVTPQRVGFRSHTFFQPSLPSTCENHTAAAAAATTTTSTSTSTATVTDDASTSQIPEPQRGHSKEELLGMVDYQDDGTVEEHLQFIRDPFLRGYAPADGPNLVVSTRKDDMHYPNEDEVIQANPEEQQVLQDLYNAIVARLRYRPGASLDGIYEIYQKLPEPKMAYIPGWIRHMMFQALGQPKKRNSKSMLRYFAVVADVKNAGLPLNVAEWNVAMSFASRYIGTSTTVEAESALNLWREMEQNARIRGNEVTFNILFDVASKAGNFTLAEMIYKEMENRGFAYNRYHYVSLIHFFGLQLNASGVRAAYAELVNAGAIVDSVVLNCVISGLLRCGEEEGAERVYQRMKASGETAKVMPNRDYASNKMVNKVILMFAKVGRWYEPLQEGFQSTAPLTPTITTYRLLVKHFGVVVGDLNKVAQFLDEMKFFRIPLHGAIFLALFESFHHHGGVPGSAWSERRLNGIWEALLEALDGGAEELTIETWLAIWALRAFDRCSSRERVLQVYDALESRWKLDESDTEFVMTHLHNILRKRPVHLK